MEENSYFDAFLDSIYSRKYECSVSHSVTSDKEYKTRPVKYNLRSNEWRNGVRKSAKENIEKAKSFIFECLL